MKKLLAILMVLVLMIPAFAMAEPASERTRVIVTCDLECDDIDSFRHMLLYANDIDLEAAIYSASTHHWTGDGEHMMKEVIDSYQKNGDLYEWRPMEIGILERIVMEDYAACYGNLRVHDSDYPTPGELREKIFYGNIQFEGDMRFDTEGSNKIKECILDDDPRTLYVSAWGGANTIARALKSIEDEYANTDQWEAIYEKVCNKLLFISWGDQDNTTKDYISVKWPGVTHLYCITGLYGYNSSKNAPETVQYTFKPDWLIENIKFNHGPLMGNYLLFGDGTYYVGETDDNQFGFMSSLAKSWLSRNNYDRYEFISEGDSPNFMYLLPCGLRGLENPSYGSWGGRPATSSKRASEYNPVTGKNDGGYSLTRWVDTYQNDWAARADWCVASNYEDANHEPVVTADVLDYTLAPGKIARMSVNATDPDGDALTQDWITYIDASVYSGAARNLEVWQDVNGNYCFTVPNDAVDGDYFNIVCKVTDNGIPALSRFAQFIITVAVPQK